MVVLIPIGEVGEIALKNLRHSLAKVFNQETKLGSAMALPKRRWDEPRGKYLVSVVLAAILCPTHSGDRFLGVVDVDLFAPGLNFVFGEEDVSGGRAVISLWRLRPEFYGLPSDENLFQERAVKEAVYQLGLTYGLEQCPDSACVMHFSNRLDDIDAKGWHFCSRCREKWRGRWSGGSIIEEGSDESM
jgi:archaemetzincin